MPRQLVIKPVANPGDLPHNQSYAPVGRPSSYKQEYCQLVLDLGRKGYSQAMIIREVAAGCRTTAVAWMKNHPEFNSAMTRARDLALAFMEEIGLTQAHNRDFNSNLYRIIMLGRFGDAGYREKMVVEQVAGEAGIDVAKLSAEEREVLAAILTKARTDTITQSSPALTTSAEADPAGPKRADISGSVH